MAKFKNLIEKPASKSSLTVKLDADISNLQDDVKQLIKETGSRLNLDKALQPILRNMLQDAKHQLTEIKQEQLTHQASKIQAPKKEVEAVSA